MKTSLFLAALAVIVTSGAARAEDLGKIKQPLGEQCSVITNYIEPTDGGCGGDGTPTPGNIKINAMAALEGYKTYNIQIDVVNQADLKESAYHEANVRFSRDETWHLDGFLYPLQKNGRYQVNFYVINALTGTVVCQNQSLVTAAR